jgi:hypothetical protein
MTSSQINNQKIAAKVGAQDGAIGEANFRQKNSRWIDDCAVIKEFPYQHPQSDESVRYLKSIWPNINFNPTRFEIVDHPVLKFVTKEATYDAFKTSGPDEKVLFIGGTPNEISMYFNINKHKSHAFHAVFGVMDSRDIQRYVDTAETLKSISEDIYEEFNNFMYNKFQHPTKHFSTPHNYKQVNYKATKAFAINSLYDQASANVVNYMLHFSCSKMLAVQIMCWEVVTTVHDCTVTDPALQVEFNTTNQREVRMIYTRTSALGYRHQRKVLADWHRDSAFVHGEYMLIVEPKSHYGRIKVITLTLVPNYGLKTSFRRLGAMPGVLRGIDCNEFIRTRRRLYRFTIVDKIEQLIKHISKSSTDGFKGDNIMQYFEAISTSIVIANSEVNTALNMSSDDFQFWAIWAIYMSAMIRSKVFSAVSQAVNIARNCNNLLPFFHSLNGLYNRFKDWITRREERDLYQLLSEETKVDHIIDIDVEPTVQIDTPIIKTVYDTSPKDSMLLKVQDDYAAFVSTLSAKEFEFLNKTTKVKECGFAKAKEIYGYLLNKGAFTFQPICVDVGTKPGGSLRFHKSLGFSKLYRIDDYSHDDALSIKNPMDYVGVDNLNINYGREVKNIRFDDLIMQNSISYLYSDLAEGDRTNPDTTSESNFSIVDSMREFFPQVLVIKFNKFDKYLILSYSKIFERYYNVELFRCRSSKLSNIEIFILAWNPKEINRTDTIFTTQMNRHATIVIKDYIEMVVSENLKLIKSAIDKMPPTEPPTPEPESTGDVTGPDTPPENPVKLPYKPVEKEIPVEDVELLFSLNNLPNAPNTDLTEHQNRVDDEMIELQKRFDEIKKVETFRDRINKKEEEDIKLLNDRLNVLLADPENFKPRTQDEFRKQQNVKSLKEYRIKSTSGVKKYGPGPKVLVDDKPIALGDTIKNIRKEFADDKSGLTDQELEKKGVTGFQLQQFRRFASRKMQAMKFSADFTKKAKVNADQKIIHDLIKYLMEKWYSDSQDPDLKDEKLYELIKQAIKEVETLSPLIRDVKDFPVCVVDGVAGCGKSYSTMLYVRERMVKDPLVSCLFACPSKALKKGMEADAIKLNMPMDRCHFKTCHVMYTQKNDQFEKFTPGTQHIIVTDEYATWHVGQLLLNIALYPNAEHIWIGDIDQTAYHDKVGENENASMLNFKRYISGHINKETRTMRFGPVIKQLVNLFVPSYKLEIHPECKYMDTTYKIQSLEETILESKVPYLCFSKEERDHIKSLFGEQNVTALTVKQAQGISVDKVYLYVTDSAFSMMMTNAVHGQVVVALTRQKRELVFIDATMERTFEKYMNTQKIVNFNDISNTVKFVETSKAIRPTRLERQFRQRSTLLDDVHFDKDIILMACGKDTDHDALNSVNASFLVNPEGKFHDGTLRAAKLFDRRELSVSLSLGSIRQGNEHQPKHMITALRTAVERSNPYENRPNNISKTVQEEICRKFIETYIKEDIHVPDLVNIANEKVYAILDKYAVIKNKLNKLDLNVLLQSFARTFIKNQQKVKTETTPWEGGAGQEVISWSTDVSLVFQGIANVLKELLKSILKENYVVTDGLNDNDIRERIQGILLNLNGVEGFGTGDFKKYDTSQNKGTLGIEIKIYEWLFGPNLAYSYYKLLRESITYFGPLFKRKPLFNRPSGEPFTWFGNTILTMAITAYCMKSEPEAGIFCGDDSNMFLTHLVPPDEFWDIRKCVLILGQEGKISTGKIGEFCGHIVTDNGLYFIAPRVVALKLLAKNFANKIQIIPDYQNAIKDMSDQWLEHPYFIAHIQAQLLSDGTTADQILASMASIRSATKLSPERFLRYLNEKLVLLK